MVGKMDWGGGLRLPTVQLIQTGAGVQPVVFFFNAFTARSGELKKNKRKAERWRWSE